MMKKLMFQRRMLATLIVGAVITLSTCSRALAVLYAYEGFSYTPGSPLAGLNGGTGWDLPANDPAYTAFVSSPGWQGMTRLNGTTIETIGADTIQAGSLTYLDTAGNSLTTSGGYLLNTGSSGAISQGGRFLSQRRSTGTTWISFLIQRQGADDGTAAGGLYPRGANLALFDQTSDGATSVDHETIDLGPNNSNVFLPVNGVDEDRFQVRVPTVNAGITEANLPNASVNRPTSNTNTTRQVQDGFTADQRQSLNFFVMRIDHLGGSADGDDVRIWMNPRLDQTPSDANVSVAYIHADILAAAAAPEPDIAPYGAYPAQGTPPGGTADTSVGDQAFTRLRLFAGNLNGASPFAELKIDEIRVGSMYADVAPFTGGGVQGDYNGNGTVDASDYVLWRKGGPLQNDPTPGVQPTDYDFWKGRFGATSGAGSVLGANVPEPHSVLLLVLALMGLGVRRSAIRKGIV